MQPRRYFSGSLSEGTCILSREWSRHRVGIARDAALRLRFSIRSLTPQLSISALAYGAAATVLPQDRADVLLLQMPRAGSAQVSYPDRSLRMDAGHYALIDVRHVAQVQCSAELDVLVLRIGIERVMQWLAQTLGCAPRAELALDPLMACGSPAWAAWAPVAAALDALERSPLANFPELAMHALEGMVISTLLTTQPNNYRDALLRPAPAIAPRHVRQAEHFIHANLARAPTTEQIAREAQVSVCALFDGFRRFRQTTPAAYVREARLAEVRAELLRGDDSDSVASIARRWGFLHAGHFATSYRRRFGEAPSDTYRLRIRLH